MEPMIPHPGRHLAVIVVCSLVALSSTATRPFASKTAAAVAPELTRYPYLTDLVQDHVIVNWATDQSATSASVKWGTSGDCTAHTVAATRQTISVSGMSEYQWQASVAGLSADTAYCYRVFLGGTDLLGDDPSPVFRSQITAGAGTAFSFAVFGDWGEVDANGNNPEQANLMSEIAGSGVRFAVTTGDTGYPGGTQDNYGDLLHAGNNLSAIFGPQFWSVAGSSIPLFNAQGNHGFNSVPLVNWPQDRAVSTSGGRYAMEDYCCTNGTVSGHYPSTWYAFDAGTARLYVLEAAWSDSNDGTADPYQNDHDNHWTPTSDEYEWLKADLEAHPGGLKFAFWHYPMYSDNPTEDSSLPLRGADSLEGLLAANGVDIGFNGHAHLYERNKKPANGILTYLTGGGGGHLEPVGGAGCSSWDAYAIGWSYSANRGSACGAAAIPSSKAHVFHFLKVSVNGSTVTVSPTDSTGQVFDQQTYTFDTSVPDSEAPSRPTGLEATAASGTQVDLRWNPATDNVGVTGYDVWRNGAKLAAIGATTSYSDATAKPATSYSYAVVARDAAGNASPASAAASVTTPDTSPPSAPTGLKAPSVTTSQVSLTWNASTDDVGVTGYEVSRNGSPLASLGNVTTFTDAAVAASTTYSYTVTARDAARNVSAASPSLAVTTPAVQPPPPPPVSVTRIGGGDRYATAADVSAATFAPGVAAAFVATGTVFPDALAAGPVAARLGGPVLLTLPGSLPASTAAELARLRPQRIYVLGSSGAVSDAVVAQLHSYSSVVTRLGGADRYETATIISHAFFSPGPSAVFVATGANFPDALSGGAAAALMHGPMLLVRDSAIPAATASEIQRLHPAHVYVLGSAGVVSDAVASQLGSLAGAPVTRLAGADRYATAAAISQHFFGSGVAATYVATGAAFPDALAAVPPAGRAASPVLLTRPSALPSNIAAELERLSPEAAYVLGSAGAVSDSVVNSIISLLNGS
jgi:putative cell wall-binding protein